MLGSGAWLVPTRQQEAAGDVCRFVGDLHVDGVADVRHDEELAVGQGLCQGPLVDSSRLFSAAHDDEDGHRQAVCAVDEQEMIRRQLVHVVGVETPRCLRSAVR